MDEKEQLKQLLTKDSYALRTLGDKVDGFETVSVEVGEARRWSQWITIVTQTPTDKFYVWGYDQGLTENQEDEDFDGTLKLVQPVTRTIVVTEWVEVK